MIISIFIDDVINTCIFIFQPSTPTKPVVFAEWVSGMRPPDPNTINKHVHDMVEVGCFLVDYMNQAMRKPTFFICENKGADQLRSNCEADQRLCFHYMDSAITLLSKSKLSSL